MEVLRQNCDIGTYCGHVIKLSGFELFSSMTMADLHISQKYTLKCLPPLQSIKVDDCFHVLINRGVGMVLYNTTKKAPILPPLKSATIGTSLIGLRVTEL